ncbi:hypothetical protein DFH07DRAFT_338222 [Mycena maculata]|uniref:Transmembrane protein n=1 Tax=Mycena maculata TaxID=230809 RepID=A0AAD7MHS3_9AGAR|nr:hypothetical protein DFH07DRAFT_338222 [Mycena maculata]
MGIFSSRLLLASTLFIAGCHGLTTHSFLESCTTDASHTTRRSVDRPSIGGYTHSEALLSRSLKFDTSKIIAISAAVVGGLAVCGILVILLWYRRGNAAFFSKEELSRQEEGFVEMDDKIVPPSPRYIAPLPRVYAARWASLVGSPAFSIAQPSVNSLPNDSPDLVIPIPTDEPPKLRSGKVKRVPVPRLSRLPSADPRASLARIRDAFRPPRQQDLKGLARSSNLKPKPKAPPSPLPIVQDTGRASNPDIASGIPSALSSAAPLTSRLTTLMNKIQSEYNV